MKWLIDYSWKSLKNAHQGDIDCAEVGGGLGEDINYSLHTAQYSYTHSKNTTQIITTWMAELDVEIYAWIFLICDVFIYQK